MTLIDFILNIVGLLLWVNWRGAYPAAVKSNKSPQPARSWYLAALVALLLGRAIFYWQAGTPLHWVPGLRFSSFWLAFRSDLPARMLLYSLLSFGATLGFFYLCLLLISSMNGPGHPEQQWVRSQLGRLDRWPAAVKLLLPLAVMTALWCSLNPLLRQIDMVPSVSTAHLLEQGALIGLSSYLTLKFLVVGILILSVLNSYIYLGESAFLKFISATSHRMLTPFRKLPLRIGRVDFAPFAAMTLILVVAEFGRRGLDRL